MSGTKTRKMRKTKRMSSTTPDEEGVHISKVNEVAL